MKTKRTALKTDLFAQVHHQDKLNQLGDPLQNIAQHIDFDALAQSIESYMDYGDQAKGGPTTLSTERHGAYIGSQTPVQPF